MKEYYITFFSSTMNQIAAGKSSYEELQKLLQSKNVKRLEKKEFEIDQEGYHKKTYIFKHLFTKQIVYVLEQWKI